MKIPNASGVTLDELCNRVLHTYPNATIKKPFLSPRSIIVPLGNIKHVIRERRGNFVFDFVPPVWLIVGSVVLSMLMISLVFSLIYGELRFGIGGALWIVLSILLLKAAYKNKNREMFEVFYNDVQGFVNNSRDANSIF